MAKKTTLADIANILKSKKTKGDTSFWGVVNSVITDSQGNTTGYNVSLDGTATGTVKCNKVVGAEVGDQVLVTLRTNGEAVVIATKGGDVDALNAQATAEEAQETAEDAQETADAASATASSAYSKATEVENYFWHDSAGAHISTSAGSTSGLNTLINSGGMAVRSGTTELSTFSDSLIELGKNNSNAQISFCGGAGMISQDDEGQLFVGKSTSNAQYGILGYDHITAGSLELIAGSASDRSYIKLTRNGNIELHPYGSLTCYENHIAIENSNAGFNELECTKLRCPNSYIYFAGLSKINVTSTSNTSYPIVRVDGTDGQLYKYGTTSSRRYKTDITEEINEDLKPSHLYDMPMFQYKYKDGFLVENDQRVGKDIFGIIVEELEKVYPIAVEYNEEGQPDSWNDFILIPAMLGLIKDQHTEIEQLKQRVERLEAK